MELTQKEANVITRVMDWAVRHGMMVRESEEILYEKLEKFGSKVD